MKKIITILVLFINFIVFAQETKSVSSGYITFNSNSTVHFESLTIDAENVTYFIASSQNQMTYSLSGVKKIVDNYGNLIYQSDKEAEANKKGKVEYITRDKTEKEKLVYKSSAKILMNGEKLDNDKLERLFFQNTEIYNRYKKGKSGATIGTIMMGGGLGLFLGGGLSNLSSANNGNKKGSPAILIAGIAIGVVGIPVRIVGVNNLKKAVRDYNELSVGQEVSFLQRSEFKIIASAGGVGLQWQF